MFKTLLFALLLILSYPVMASFDEDLSDTLDERSMPALRELHAKAVAGDSQAQLNLGGVYLKGELLPPDYAEAAKWFKLAAQQGSGRAQFNLGIMYSAGKGVELDYAEAARYYRLAAIQGISQAQLNLGVAYATGQGVAKDYALAAKWFRLAAVQGEPQAQFNIAVIYANGQGVEPNLSVAYHWAGLAAAQGHETAQALHNDLARNMSAEQIAASNLIPVAIPPVRNGEIYLQLGAYKTEAEAQKMQEKLHTKLGKMNPPYRMLAKESRFRIQLGPYTDLTIAKKSALDLKEKLGYEPMIKNY